MSPKNFFSYTLQYSFTQCLKYYYYFIYFFSNDSVSLYPAPGSACASIFFFTAQKHYLFHKLSIEYEPHSFSPELYIKCLKITVDHGCLQVANKDGKLELCIFVTSLC